MGGLGGTGAGGMCPPFLSDQLTLSQPGGANYAHNIITCSSDFQTFLWPCRVLKNNSIFASGHYCDNFVPIDEVQTGHWPLSLTVCRYGRRSKNCGVGSNLESAPNNSNETHTFMCLGRTGRFGQR